MGAPTRFILFLLIISSCFFCHLAQARTQHHHHRKKKHVNHSMASPPMAEPLSEDSDPPSSSISLPPALSPEPADDAPTLNYTTHDYSPPPQPISNAGYGANSTNSNSVIVSHPAPPQLPAFHQGDGGNSAYNFTAPYPFPLPPVQQPFSDNYTNSTSTIPSPPLPLPIYQGYGGNSTNTTAPSPSPLLESPSQGSFSGSYTNSTSTAPPPFPLTHHVSGSAPAPAPAPAPESWAGNLSNSAAVFNVRDFGAVGDGVSDDTEAFKAAWDSACEEQAPGIILVPRDYSFKIRSTFFSCPSKSDNITLEIEGTIMPPDGPDEWLQNNTKRQWLMFYQANGLKLAGGGLIDGKGEKWWNLPCKPHKGENGTTLPGPCESPVALRFFDSSNVTVHGIRIQNSPHFHFRFDNCKNVSVDSISISAPALSPNTDGIHVENTEMVSISNSIISNGDDCVSIGAGVVNMDIRNITCGPSHGISIGSLGSKNSHACVSNIRVKDCVIKHSDNGVRIKTWQGGSGSVSAVSFDNIRMEAVRNPIIIDQYYCQSKPCKNQTSAVYISDVSYTNIKGTFDVRSQPIHLACSDTMPCTNVTLSGVELFPATVNFISSPLCWNVYGEMETLTIPPVSCFLQGFPQSITEKASSQC